MQDFISLGLLGLVQGLTEFLPVSSTGHLILAREFFGFGGTLGLTEDAILHLATALAVLIYFQGDIRRLGNSVFSWALGSAIEQKEKNLILALIFGTIPAIIVGLLFESAIETVLRNSIVVAAALVGGSLVFLLAEYVHRKNFNQKSELNAIVASEHISPIKGFFIGFFQAVALIPGMSRSGMTIAGGMLLGLSRVEAARFAFLLSFPVILGAGSLKLLQLIHTPAIDVAVLPLLFGSLVAFVSGMAAIHFLISFLKTHTLLPFVVYRLILAGIILFVAL